jgi:hypothetical protein
LVNVLERRFTYVVGDVEEELITWQRNGVQPAVMEKRQLSKGILGELRPFIGKEYGKTLIVHSNMVWIFGMDAKSKGCSYLLYF